MQEVKMKPKTFNKKLSLSKTTIANLSHKKMEDVFAGKTEPSTYTWGDYSCPETYCYTLIIQYPLFCV
jgi:hypothetical protein